MYSVIEERNWYVYEIFKIKYVCVCKIIRECMFTDVQMCKREKTSDFEMCDLHLSCVLCLHQKLIIVMLYKPYTCAMTVHKSWNVYRSSIFLIYTTSSLF